MKNVVTPIKYFFYAKFVLTLIHVKIKLTIKFIKEINIKPL